MNTSSLTGLIAQNKMYDSHRRKIQSIMTRSSNSLSFRKRDALTSFYSSHDRAQRYTQRCKQEAVEKQNDLILRKIIDVNRRGSQGSQGNTARKQISHNNLSNLRKKLIKTNEENLKFANKLVGASSKLNQSLLGADYRKHAQIKQRIQKYTNDPSTGLIIPKKVKSLVRLGRLDPLRGDMSSSRVDNQEY